MPITDTPLRYPGGKTKLYKTIQPIIALNKDPDCCIYVEPFAGGAGLALRLLFRNDVDYLVLNDLDYGIYSFWHSCLHNNAALCKMISNCSIDIDTWEIQKSIYNNHTAFSMLQVGFATFFLNRCNVSGVINGGIIGGYEQLGKYKINARFNKTELISKIQKIGQYSNRISFFNMDADLFLKQQLPSYCSHHLFLNIDPPYVKKGPMLYKNSFTTLEHSTLAQTIQSLPYKWIVTYDKCDFIDALYSKYNRKVLELNYSAGATKQGNEYIIFSDNINLPQQNTNANIMPSA